MDPRSLDERLTIRTPCQMKWGDMQGDERVRHCAACRLDVYNVREMTTPEVEALLQPGGRVCVRLYRRNDGTVVTGDCRRIWTTERSEALALLSTVTTVAGAIALLVTIAVLSVILFGDDLRKLLGESTAGALAGTGPAPTLPVTQGARLGK
ncbi:hypothetical protein JGU66_13975 [Myxococcaceae bacterium JPH2]|nr:hypothetical protein [Myxococcaceae bacterium JPH2]